MGPSKGPLTGLFRGLLYRPLLGPVLLSGHTIDTSSTFIIIIPHPMPFYMTLDLFLLLEIASVKQVQLLHLRLC